MMLPLAHRSRCVLRWGLILYFGLQTSPALAVCKERTAHWYDWDRCWCGWPRLGLLLLALAVLVPWCFNYVFLRHYLQKKQPPLWPREAFWRSVGWFVFLFTGAVVGVYAGFSDELRQTQWFVLPAWASWLDRNWPWVAILVGGAFIGLLIVLVSRRPRTQNKLAPTR